MQTEKNERWNHVQLAARCMTGQKKTNREKSRPVGFQVEEKKKKMVEAKKSSYSTFGLVAYVG